MKKRAPRLKKTNVSSREVFIVRLWRATRGELLWLGQVQHVRTGQIVSVRGAEELIEYLQSQMDRADEMPASSSLR